MSGGRMGAVGARNAATFNPLQYGTPVHGFWAADPDWTPPADTAEVLSWRNGGSNGTALTTTTGNAPTYITSGINGKPVVRFNGTNSTLAISAAAGGTISQPLTVVLVKSRTSASGGRTYLTGNSTATTRVDVYKDPSNASETMYAANVQNVSPDTTAPNILIAAFNGTSSTMIVNGLPFKNRAPGAYPLAGLRLGSFYNNSTYFLNGDIPFAAVYSGDATSQSWLYDLQRGLSIEYGIDIFDNAFETTVSTYNSGEGYTAYVPNGYVGAKPIVFFMHGYLSTHTQMQTYLNNAMINTVCASLAELGYLVMSIDAGGTSHWGNNTMIASVDAAITYANTTWSAPTTNVSFIGASMGGLSLAWIRANLADTACFAGLAPVSDLTDAGVDTPYGAAIDTAYGGTYSNATDGPAHNPDVFAATGDLAGLAYKAWYGASDTVVPGATVTAVATAIGGTASTVSITGNHGSVITSIPPQDVIDFIVANT